MESDWETLNLAYLDRELRRLRLLIQRRILWLRSQWRHDPLQDYRGLVISEDQANWLSADVDRDAEARFYRDNPEAASVTESIAEVEVELAAHLEALRKSGTPSAIEEVVRHFDLSPFEREVLLLCLAPHLDPAFERLYAYVQDDINRNHATPHLALNLFSGGGEGWLDARNSFLPGAPLRRFRLVALGSESPLGARPLDLDDRMAAYLRGDDRIDQRIGGMLQPMPSALHPQGHELLEERLVQAFQSGAHKDPVLRLNIIGPPGRGRRDLARSLSDGLGLRVFELNLRDMPEAGHDMQDLPCLLEREATLSGFAVYIDVEKVGGPAERTARTSLIDAIESRNIFLIVGSRERYRSEGNLVPVRLPKLDAHARLALWKQALNGAAESLEGQLEAIVQQFHFGPQAILQAAETAKNLIRFNASEDNDRLQAEHLWQACREQAGWDLNPLGQRISSSYTWDDIVLPEDVLRQLQEIAAQVGHRAHVYERWGFGARLSRGRGISALFAGPSGTGKTMAAEILANHLNLSLYRIDLAGVVSKYVGETEKNLQKVFDAAEQSGAILFFDEADALFGKRTQVRDSHDRYANIEVNYLLQRMEDYRGLAVLATNRKSALDEAFLRRLRFQVDFPFPDANSRRRIWKKVYPQETEVDGLDYDLLAGLKIPGGSIQNIALNAAFLAAADGGAVKMSQVMHATRREYSKLDRLLTEAEFGPYYRQVTS